MAVLKVACPKCGQRVSGDESFFGTSVECPVCTSKVVFPEKPGAQALPIPEKKPEPEPKAAVEDAESDPYLPRSESTPIPLLSPPSQPEPDAGDEHGSPLLGVISMVIGIVTVVCLCLPGILLGPLAVVCGHMGLASVAAQPDPSGPG